MSEAETMRLPLFRSRRYGKGGMVNATLLIGPAFMTLGIILIIVGQTSSSITTLFPRNYMRKKTELKGPTKEELGRSSWTLIHTMAANYPDKPTSAQREHASRFFSSLGSLYPCPLCRDHFDRYVSVNKPDVTTRERLLLWTCEAHNEVNRRNNKPIFPCIVTKLDKRWGDCGCSSKESLGIN